MLYVGMDRQCLTHLLVPVYIVIEISLSDRYCLRVV